MDTSNLAKRMKTYEAVSKNILMKRVPVALRIDGRAFHTFARGFEKPFDEILMKSMQETTKYLCENIQGCVLGYTQSDEISLILVDYDTFDTSAWFDYEVQKLTSIAASMATMAFNKFFTKNVKSFELRLAYNDYGEDTEENRKLLQVYLKALEKGAMFDARVFNLAKEEVANYIYWRQLDASRNSVQMVGQANFSHRELQNKSCSDIQDMLMTQKSINWNNLPTDQKRGSCVVYVTYEDTSWTRHSDETPVPDSELRSEWVIDRNIPIFKGDARAYIEERVLIGDGDAYDCNKTPTLQYSLPQPMR